MIPKEEQATLQILPCIDQSVTTKPPEEQELIAAKKKVSFYRRVKTKMVQSHRQYSARDRMASWYTAQEYADIKRRCIGTLHRMKMTDFIESSEHCPRGLEVHTPEGYRARREIRQKAVQLVLGEQRIQEQWGVFDDERLRNKVLSISNMAHYQAQRIGLRDKREALEHQFL